MRIGTMAAAKAQCPQPAHGVAEVLRGDLEGQVSPVQAMMGERLLEHVLRGVSAHVRREQSQQRLYRGTGHGDLPIGLSLLVSRWRQVTAGGKPVAYFAHAGQVCNSDPAETPSCRAPRNAQVCPGRLPGRPVLILVRSNS